MSNNLQVKGKLQAHGRFWLTLECKNFLGRGRVELLQRIAETGSISQAAKAMKMSYKAAWDAVDAMNHAWGKPLVESHPGGSNLTTDATRLMAVFIEAEKKHKSFLTDLADELTIQTVGNEI
jgi:molybdate transport system regulatory protein